MLSRIITQTVLSAIFSAITFFISNLALYLGLEIKRIFDVLFPNSAPNENGVVDTTVANNFSIDNLFTEISKIQFDFFEAFSYHSGYSWYYLAVAIFIVWFGIVSPFKNIYFAYANEKDFMKKQRLDKLPHRQNEKARKDSERNRIKQGVDKTTNFGEKVLVVEEVTMPIDDEVVAISREKEKVDSINKIEEKKPFNKRVVKGSQQTDTTKPKAKKDGEMVRNPRNPLE